MSRVIERMESTLARCLLMAELSHSLGSRYNFCW